MLKYWRGGVWENKELPCIWPVGLRGVGDFGYSFPKDMSLRDEVVIYNDVMNEQRKTVKELLPCSEPPVFTFTLYTEMLKKYEAAKDEFDIADDVIIVWPDNNQGEMRTLPKKHGKWKHGVYYHLAYTDLGGRTKQSAHVVSAKTITTQFHDIVQSGATEFLLVNVSQLREYVMSARLIAEISWDPDKWLNRDDPDQYYLHWWNNEYFGPNDIGEKVAVYNQYYELLDFGNKLWFGSDLVLELLDNLVNKLAGKPFNLIKEDKINQLKTRAKQYQSLMELIAKVTKGMTMEQNQYFFENAQLGLLFDWRPTQAALLLHKALSENNRQKIWDLVMQASKPLEQLEIEILKAERPPFDKWYRETWIRGKLTGMNVHRSYELIRTFISSKGKISKPPDISQKNSIRQYQIWNQYTSDSEQHAQPLSWLNSSYEM